MVTGIEYQATFSPVFDAGVENSELPEHARASCRYTLVCVSVRVDSDRNDAGTPTSPGLADWLLVEAGRDVDCG